MIVHPWSQELQDTYYSEKSTYNRIPMPDPIQSAPVEPLEVKPVIARLRRAVWFKFWQFAHPRWWCAYRHTREWVFVERAGVACDPGGHLYWTVS